MKLQIPYHRQREIYTCGAATLQMVSGYFKKWHSQAELERLTGAQPERGTPNSEMIRAATDAGFFCYVNENSSLYEIKHFMQKGLPVVVNYIEPSRDEGHFAVVSGFNRRSIILNDPWNGQNFRLKQAEFVRRWHAEIDPYKRWLMVIAPRNFRLGKQYAPTPAGAPTAEPVIKPTDAATGAGKRSKHSGKLGRPARKKTAWGVLVPTFLRRKKSSVEIASTDGV